MNIMMGLKINAIKLFDYVVFVNIKSAHYLNIFDPFDVAFLVYNELIEYL